ncbi:MAG: hypothetical protein IJZ74_00200 [Clostridia bacterium]|nr:hypothetical protein [Clostridia bacterium]
MKKFLAILLSIMMLLGMTAAMAEEGGEEQTPVQTTAIEKVYTGMLPVGDTLTFTIECVETVGVASDTPYVTLGAATENGTYEYTVTESDDLTNSIALNVTYPETYGTYTYKITETSTGNTNVTAVKDTVYLQVYNLKDSGKGCTVVGAPDATDTTKNDTFENAYAVGSVEVTKKITGNAANYTDTFPATITLTSDKPLTGAALQWDGADITYTLVPDSTYKYSIAVTLGGAEESTKTLTGVPVGVTVEIAEDEASLNGYTANVTGNGAAVAADAAAKLEVTNEKSTDIPTGVYMDYIPYVLLLAVAVAGLAGFVVKRRLASRDED